MKLCTGCGGFYSSASYYRHRRKCENQASGISGTIATSIDETDETFKIDVLSKINQDNVGLTVLSSSGMYFNMHICQFFDHQ